MDVDLLDWAAFQRCSRINPGPQPVECEALDFYHDGRLDLEDLKWFVCAAGGPNIIRSAVTLNVPDDPTNQTQITLNGTSAGWQSVRISGGLTTTTINLDDCAFSTPYNLIPNTVNWIYATGLLPDGTASAPTGLQITHDQQPPSLFIDFPIDGATVTTDSTDVAGRVGDTLSGFMGLTVTVNGVSAAVNPGIGTNGTFFLTGVPLAPDGPTIITAVARDALQNQSSPKQITVTQTPIPENAPQMTIVSGNGQQPMPIHSLLPEPITVQVLRGDGAPFANKVVSFHVTRSDGRLTADGAGDGSMMLQVHTDDAGLAGARWRLGSDAGMGNNRVEVTSASIVGTVVFCASATPAPAGQINIGSGNNQRAEVGAPAPEPLEAWVSDGCNPVKNMAVTFTVTQGGGKVNGQDSITVNTDTSGHADVNFTLGPDPGNNAVEASFPNNPTGPATFIAFGLVRDATRPTRFTGLVLDNASQPIAGARCTLVVADQGLFTSTDANGQFAFEDVPAAGAADLVVDGRYATAVGGEAISPCIDAGGSPLPDPCLFPFLHYEPVLVPNAANALPSPILIPRLDPANRVPYRGTQDAVLTVAGVDGLEMTVKAGTRVTLLSGHCVDPDDPLCTGDPGCNAEFGGPCVTLALNQVHHDDVPMPMPDGAAPPFAWTLQPAGTTFNPPVKVTYPNMSGLPAGAIANFLSFDHDTMQFEIVAGGHVTADGSCIETDPGDGIDKAGWGCNCPPYSVTGNCCTCNTSTPPLDETREAGGFKVYAPPLFFGPWVTAYGGNGPHRVTISAQPQGDTTIFGQVHYYACETDPNQCGSGGVEKTVSFGAVTSVFTADAFANVRVRFKGIPLGSVVNGSATVVPFPCCPQSSETSSARVGLDQSWNIAVNGQAGSVNPGGSFRVTNIAALDAFGESGPGSLPDFLSDDFVRIVGSKAIDGTTYYAVSQPFRLTQGETIQAEGISVTETPPALPQSIAITEGASVLEPGQGTQLEVTASLLFGGEIDVTPGSAFTTYRTSNPSVATPNENGLVTAVGDGTAFVTATNEGAAATRVFTVVSETSTTTVEGYCQREDGTPLPEAEVTVLSVKGSGLTDSQGFFSFSIVVPSTIEAINIAIRANGGTQAFLETVYGLPIIPNGITDAGIIVVSPYFGDLDLGPWPQFRGNNRKTGSLIAPGPATTLSWRRGEIASVSRGGIAIAASGDIYFKSRELGGSFVYRIDGGSGQVLAQSPNFGLLSSGVTIGADALYTTSLSPTGTHVTILDRITLGVISEISSPAFGSLGDAPIVSLNRNSPSGTHTLYVTDTSQRAIHAIDAGTNQVLWTFLATAPQVAGSRLGPIWLGDDGRQVIAFFGNQTSNGAVALADNGDGSFELLWTGGPVGFNWMGTGVLSSDASRIYVATFANDGADVIWAIDATNGKPIWSVPSNSGVRNFFGRPAVVGDRIYAGGHNGRVTAVIDEGETYSVPWEYIPASGQFAEFTSISAVVTKSGTTYLYAVDQGNMFGQLLVLRDDGLTYTEILRTSLNGTMGASGFGSNSASIDNEGCVYIGSGRTTVANGGEIYRFCP
ncbi:MAG: PQQ-binding-like beta-propeller repeat protein [Phycisphaerales bacterium]|nr:PQQ-binding-like beta-propeller repeat protein [Phycisphaerales bacterium]